MRMKFCVACGDDRVENLEHHHMVPKAYGGGDDEANILTLCHACHGRMHGYQRMSARALSAAGMAKPGARGRARAAAKRAGKKRSAADAGHFAEVVRPALQIEFHGVRATAREGAAALARMGIKNRYGGAWTAAALRRAAARAGYLLAHRDDGYGAWARQWRGICERMVAARVVSYAAAAAQLRAEGRAAYGAEGWTETAARRLFRALGLRLAGNAAPETLARAVAAIPVASGSAHTTREYGRYWRGFMRWRGREDGLPVTDMELAAFMEARLAQASASTARHLMSGISHVHALLGHDRLSLRPVARAFMERKRKAGIHT